MQEQSRVTPAAVGLASPGDLDDRYKKMEILVRDALHCGADFTDILKLLVDSLPSEMEVARATMNIVKDEQRRAISTAN